MKNILKCIFLFSISAATFCSCNKKESVTQKVDIGKENAYAVIADTIITDVLIQNPSEDEWIDFCLKNLKKDALVEEIFNSVYSGKLIPFEFFSNTPIEISAIKSLESNPEFSRDKIAKVQFEEAWYFDTENHIMVKKVYSIMLAYEVFNLEGEVKGYKPAFKVYFK